MAKHHEQNPVVIPMEDDIIHTADHPFCSTDPTCGCHEDPELLAEVAAQVGQGLLTHEEATQVIAGKTV
jgi:hypothetical protein